MKRALNTLVVLITVAWGNSATAFLPEANSVPGGIAVVPLVKSQNEKPQAWFGQRRLLVTHEEGIWYAIIGLDINQVPGRYIVKFSTPSLRETTRPFNIYTATSVKENLENVEKKETEFLEILKRQWRETDVVNLPLHTPLPNATAKLYTEHPFYGLVYSLPEDMQVNAPATGTIAVLQEIEQTGLTLAIDHGQGLMSLFLNLKEILVKPDEVVSTTDIVAIAGASDNKDPAALVWVVLFNGNQIDPRNLMIK